MKLFKFTFFIGLLTTFMVFTSCKKEEKKPVIETPVEEPTPISSVFSAKVDGVDFNSAVISKQLFTVGGEEMLSINASESSGFPSISIVIPSDIAFGAYLFKGSTGDVRGMYNISNSATGSFNALQNTGSIVIKSHDMSAKVIEAIFEFDAEPSIGNSSTDTYSITQGAFKIQY